ncbi:MAG: hypothetical protein IJT36_09205 [Alphaproteobacteria bacterium]|nr:hypothetical protein [Alphaproteobacteria bacterium]
MKYSDIAEACVKSGKTTGQYLRSSIRETVAKFDFNGGKPAANEIVLLCPIKLYDRIICIRTKANAASTGAKYRLGLYSKGTGDPELIAYLTNALSAGTITAAAKDIWTEEGAIDTEGFDFETVYNVLSTLTPTDSTAGAGLTALKASKYADDTEFFLGISSTVAETGLTTLDVIIRTADGVPSAQDGNKTIS